MKALAFSFVVLLFNTSLFAEDIRFQKACDSGENITIGAVGDVLLHGPLQVQGFKQGFGSLWDDVEPWIQQADLFYANLEGPTAGGVAPGGKIKEDPGYFNDYIYSGYPQFNYHPRVIDALKQAGVDLLSTANNHSLDRRSVGVAETLSACEKYGMPCFGTRTDDTKPFHIVTQSKGWSIGWIACTFSTNGIPDPNNLVLDCFKTGRVSQLISRLKNQVDAVIVTPHWGSEYKLKPNSQQTKFARQWLEEGATAVIGTHPHVPQPWEKYVTSSGEEKFILYSSGNFVSNQSSTAKQTGLMLFLGLTKNNGKAWVNGVRYLPLYMNRKPYSIVASSWLEKASSAQSSSLKLAKEMFGTDRLIDLGESITTNAECQ